MNAKTIHRTKHTQNFTVLPNSLVRDKSLSFCARGILAFMLSHKEDWVANLKDLEELGLEGRERIRSCVHELEAAGFAVRHQTFDNNTKQFMGTVWHWSDSPAPMEKRSRKPTYGNPSVGNPLVGKVSVGKPSDIRRNSEEEELKERKVSLEVKKTRVEAGEAMAKPSHLNGMADEDETW